MDKETKPENPNAFAYGYGTDNYDRAQEGMTLRDYFANSAMQALIIHYGVDGGAGTELTERSFSIADEMLKERSKP